MINLLFQILNQYKIADYYIDSVNGNDSNTGTINLPFKTIGALTGRSLLNKRIGLKNGGIYSKVSLDGIQNMHGNKTKFLSYGTGNKPIITNSSLLSGSWTQNGNIWSYQDVNFPSEILAIWKNSVSLTLGRYPKTGYRNVTGSSVTTVTDSGLSNANNYWNGCEIVGKAYAWYFEKKRITSFTSKTFTFESTGNAIPVGYGYFIQNHVNCLTEQDEWAFDNITKTLYIYSTTQPESIYVSYNEDSVYINNCKHIEFSGIDIRQANRHGMYINESDYITVSGCDISECGRDGIYANLSYHLIHSANTIRDTYSNAIHLYCCKYSDVIDNIISNIGIVSGRGIRGQLWGNGVLVLYWADLINIKYNSIQNLGYIGIYWKQCNSMFIEYNYINNYCLRMCDGGAIYTYRNNASVNSECTTPFVQNQIKYNIIQNGRAGDANTGQSTGYSTHGIYLDNECDTINVELNYVYNPGMSCIFIKGDNNTIHGNTGYTFVEAFHLERGTGDVRQFNNNNFHDNYMILELANGQTSALYGVRTYNTSNSTVNYLTNKYYFPFGQLASKTDKRFLKGSTELSLTSWIADDAVMDWNRDGETIISPSLFVNTVKPRENYILRYYNASKNTYTLLAEDLPYDDYIDLDGVAFGASRQIEAYRSLILVRTEQ